MIRKIGFATILLLPLSAEAHERPAMEGWESHFTPEMQIAECRGEINDEMKIWLYEARKRRIIPDFSLQRCVDLGVSKDEVLGAFGRGI